MPISAFGSIKASPGVTTTVQALAEVWPEGRRLLVAEFDPAGGDLAARLDLAPEPGLVTLAAAGRRDLGPALVLEHAQRPSENLAVLLAPPAARQARGALELLADRLATALGDIDDWDVLVDCGRLDGSAPVPPWVGVADGVFVVLRPTAAEVAHGVSRLPELATDGGGPQVVLVGEPGPGRTHLYPASEVAAALNAPVVGVIADDDRAAGVFDGRRRGERLLRRSDLLRSARELAAELIGPASPDVEDPATAVLASSLTVEVAR